MPQGKRMIVAVDFGGTLCLDGMPNTPLFARLKQMQRSGDIIILWSCRHGKRLNEAVAFCMQNGLKVNFVNENAPSAIRMLGGDSRKIYADLYIDDKAVRT